MLFALYKTRDILGSAEGRLTGMALAVRVSRKQCEQAMLDLLKEKPPYIRKTYVNDNTTTYDVGSHRVFYEITKYEV